MKETLLKELSKEIVRGMTGIANIIQNANKKFEGSKIFEEINAKYHFADKVTAEQLENIIMSGNTDDISNLIPTEAMKELFEKLSKCKSKEIEAELGKTLFLIMNIIKTSGINKGNYEAVNLDMVSDITQAVSEIASLCITNDELNMNFGQDVLSMYMYCSGMMQILSVKQDIEQHGDEHDCDHCEHKKECQDMLDYLVSGSKQKEEKQKTTTPESDYETKKPGKKFY